jgi:hypothetical protein
MTMQGAAAASTSETTHTPAFQGMGRRQSTMIDGVQV